MKKEQSSILTPKKQIEIPKKELVGVEKIKKEEPN